jgi:hypothetical protein
METNIQIKDEPVEPFLERVIMPPTPFSSPSNLLSLPNPSLPNPLLIVDGVDIGGKFIGKGTTLYLEDINGLIHLVVVLELQIRDTTSVVTGLTLMEKNRSLYQVSLTPLTFQVRVFHTIVQMTPGWMRKTMTSWPDFVVFVDVPEECDDPLDICLCKAAPSPFVLCNDTAVLYNFWIQLSTALRSLLSTRNKQEKLLFTWNVGRNTQVVKSFFEKATIKLGKIIFSHYFSPLSLLLGTDYHFLDENHYSCQGWGFYAEEDLCNHYISQVSLHFGKKDMKCKAHQLLQNPSSKIFQSK